ncbi:unnamed protein product [Prorocentrum cordatum]|uniref:Protein kinase domain-containing protein n=1 Tax=Prorocentrum cordatum TaxID=2364126 RepID=A0ABN9VRJ6_9DINO|nr:unnamed protein product [Polarella glacialis]
MAASPDEGLGGMACCGRQWPCCRWARLDNGTDRLTLRFADPQKERGYANTHTAELCRATVRVIYAIAIAGLMWVLFVYRIWDDSENLTAEAKELSRWRILIFLGMLGSMILALGAGRLLVQRNIVSTPVLEALIVSSCICFVMLFAIFLPKHYLSRVFGYDDPEAVWLMNLCGTDGNVVLYIDCVVTALHLLMPIRWFVLVPMEVAAVLAYSVPALLLGSPTDDMVPANILGLLVLTVLAAVGRRSVEMQERAMFAGLIEEKQMRFQAEFELSRVDRGQAARAPRADDLGSERSAPVSLPPTTISAAAFESGAERASMDEIRAIGEREQWLIASCEVEILADRVLGEGGFGIVVAGLYHKNLVALKAPKEDIEMRLRLPELCNELRILRRIRHPNIASFYGACFDAALTRLCLVLEFVDGAPLRPFIRDLFRGSSRPERERHGAPDADGSASKRSPIVFDILNVLRYLHSRQPVVVHGDLKDSNVFVEERRGRSGRRSYRAKVLDFGLSRIVTVNAKSLGGTLRWMAPELCSRHKVPPDAAADCYSFGLLAYFIVTGRLPFEGESKDQVVGTLSRGQAPSLVWPAPADELARACRPVVERCIQPRPARRPAAQWISDELSAVLNQAVAGVTKAVLEALGTRAPSSESREKTSTRTTRGTAAGRGLKDFQGMGGLRQDSGTSVGSLFSGMVSKMPSVPEEAVPLPGEGMGGASAAPPDNPMSAQEQLVYREYKATPVSTQTLSLAYLMLQWNVPRPAASCCWVHGALQSLDKVRDELSRRPCNQSQQNTACGQCGDCALLLMPGQSYCEFCDDQSSRTACTASTAVATKSEEVFHV